MHIKSNPYLLLKATIKIKKLINKNLPNTIFVKTYKKKIAYSI